MFHFKLSNFLSISEKVNFLKMDFILDIKTQPKKYLSLIGCILLMFSASSLGTLSTMSTYYISYLREYDEINSVRYSQVIWLQTLLTVRLSILFKKKYTLHYHKA